MILTAHPTFLCDGSSGSFYAKLRGLKAIGYWKVYGGASSGNPSLDEYHRKYVEKYASLPDPKDFVDPTWREDHRRLVATYLKTQPAIERWRGSSNCRLCGIRNGSQCFGDDVFVWPQGFAHYIEAHNVRPPKEFVDHVLQKLAGSMVQPRRIIKEPEPTEEDYRRMREMEARMEEERRAAIEAGERLPPITADLWKTKD